MWTNDLLLKIADLVTAESMSMSPLGAATGFGLEAGGIDLGRWGDTVAQCCPQAQENKILALCSCPLS